MIIRTAIPDDIPQMVELLGELYALEPDFSFDRTTHARGLAILLQERGCLTLVCSENQTTKLDGMVTLQPHISSGFGCKEAVLEDLIVRESMRGKGIGTLLLVNAYCEAERMGYNRMRLAVDCDNLKAKRFYEAKGWRPGRMTSYYFDIQQ
jgi:GNAT superfamily N-acetyltransferase